MGRPSITGPTIVVDIDGELLIWTDGLLSGTKKAYVDEAKRLSKYNLPVLLTPFGPEIQADLEAVSSPEQAVAAMVGVLNGRAKIIQAPDSVLALLPFEDEDPEVGTVVNLDLPTDDEPISE
jgi:hypothetical protein